MQIVLLGPPGAGKGTQAVMLAKATGAVHVSTGDLLRAAVSAGTELGRQAEQFMKQGELVPDDLIIALIRQRLHDVDSFVLDGFPRTLPQAQALDTELANLGRQLDCVINLEVEDDELVQRLTGRRVCSDCSSNYHIQFRPPRRTGVCDQCSSELIQRTDDSEETVRNRLSVYKQQTMPLVEYYNAQGLLKTVDGTGDMSRVLDRINTQLQGTTGNDHT